VSLEYSIRHVLYLHGFASSPASSKAAFFRREIAARGLGFSCPDFNLPAFQTLTVTRMLEQTAAAIDASAGPVALIGSSLGAFVAIHAAAGSHASCAPLADRIAALVLLAPALDFGGNRLRQIGEHGIDEWRRAGTLKIFHYADDQLRDIDFTLYDDAARYDALAIQVAPPTLVVQGTRDTVVDPQLVQRWAATQPNVRLVLVDDEHQLTASVDRIWLETEALFRNYREGA
jgi:pimeloyl-ACP methyl ester carboxylesterase